MIEQIKECLSRPVCTGWDRGFLESVLGQLERGRTLSEKQGSTLQSVIDRNDSEAQRAHEQWETVYESEHKEDAMVLAYYYTHTAYFRNIATDISQGIVPERRSFLKMKDNKFAQRVLEEYRSEAKFTIGDLVTARAGMSRSSMNFGENPVDFVTADAIMLMFMKRGGFIIERTNKIVSAAKGAKMYKILPIGGTIPFFIEERKLKRKKS
jgi:hypothetical protein